jgi:transposase
MKQGITWVGMDAHKKSIEVCIGLSDGIEKRWEVPNDERKVRSLAKKLEKITPGEIRCCYEAGPCGFVLKRQLEQFGKRIVCEVIAPSLVPAKPGDRVKTDRRDARKLMQLLRSNMLTEVHVPTEREEALRDLSRCREKAVEDLKRARQRLSKWLLRRAVSYPGSNWSKKHREWLAGLRFADVNEQVVLDDHRLSIEQLELRIETLEDALGHQARSGHCREAVEWLRCFRGIDTITAIGIVAELYDVRRFDSPNKLMSYLGLTPGEYSTGESVRRTGITRTGNGHVRWLLTEAAWHYRHRPHVGVSLKKRRQGQPQWIIETADRAQHRLNRKFHRLLWRNVLAQKAVTAVARELVGFIWSVLRRWEPVPQPTN